MGVHFSPEDELTMQFKNTFMLYIYIFIGCLVRRQGATTARGDDKQPSPTTLLAITKKTRKRQKDPMKTHFHTFCVFFCTIAVIASLNESIVVSSVWCCNPRPVAGNMMKHCITYEVKGIEVATKHSKSSPLGFVCSVAPEHLQTCM